MMEILDERIKKDLLDRYKAMQDQVLSKPQRDVYYETFRRRFGLDILARLNGEALLTKLFDHGDRDSLVYWLEFKDDAEFPTYQFGSIRGGTPFKFGLFKRKETGTWVTGVPQRPKEISRSEAISIASCYRDQLIAGAQQLARLPNSINDRVYEQLQRSLERVAPDVQNTAWGHKYFCLLYPDRLDDYHNPDFQRFYLIKMLQEPPLGEGRYICAGRYVAIATELDMPIHSLTKLLDKRCGKPYRYWRVPADFATLPFRQISAGDIVLAMEGNRVLRIGRVSVGERGEAGSQVSWRSSIEWLDDTSWILPEYEPTNSIFGEIKKFVNKVEIERRLLESVRPTTAHIVQPTVPPTQILAGIPGQTPTVLDRQRLLTEDAQARGVELPFLKRESPRVEPVKRGGRPRRPTRAHEKKQERQSPGCVLKPEIVCWKRERQWILAAQIPDELLEYPNLVVLQDGVPLIQEETKEACWCLERISGDLVVRWGEDEDAYEISISLGQRGYLLFKLGGENWEHGRHIQFPSSGHYLAVVPDTWERDTILSGSPPAIPEPVSIPGYRAHFFFLERGDNEEIAFRLPDGQSLIIETKAPRFELSGKRIEDGSEAVGPLFGEGPPRIRALDAKAWKAISTVVIGEKGSGRGKWRMEFKPDPDQIEQELPSALVARKGGWYFLRFYNYDYDLIKSLDFRFLDSLKEIKILQASYLPASDGHKPVHIELVHDHDCAVELVKGNDNIRVERRPGSTLLIIPPDPACDESRWLVGPKDGRRVEITINAGRVWWAVEEADTPPSEWQDQVIPLTREDFAATSNKGLWVRFPRQRWVDNVLVGFKKFSARHYPVRATDNFIVVPLRDFGNALELNDIGETPLCLWIVSPQGTYSVSPCKVYVKVCCQFCDFTASTIDDLRFHFQSAHSDRFFRPLTYDELRERIPSLPYKIYKCSYCDFYVPSDDYRNPNSAINRHIQEECAQVDRREEPVRIRFRVISDIDEIRENVISGLQRIHLCRLCNAEFVETTPAEMMSHLIQKHGKRLYRLQ